jgi:hypothetical protein
MKICGTCKNTKDEKDFSLKNGNPQYNCKVCHSEYRKNHYEKNKQKYVDKAAKNKVKYRQDYYDWLSTQSCYDCGISDIRVLEQDHLNDKEFNVSSKVGMLSLSSMMNELNKCQVVCANCHRIRTSTRGNWTRSKMYANIV